MSLSHHGSSRQAGAERQSGQSGYGNGSLKGASGQTTLRGSAGQHRHDSDDDDDGGAAATLKMNKNMANFSSPNGRRQSDAESLPEAHPAPDEDPGAGADGPPAALKIQGATGAFKGMINGTYELAKKQSGGRAFWISRAAKASYLFHTGKARWVVSKRVDDGTHCYAFVSDSSGDPTKCKGWSLADEKGNWTQDQKVTCVQVPGSDDPFVKLRMSVEEELNKLGLNNSDTLKQLWKRLDFNGNNVVSLAEIDKMVVEMVQGGNWPEWLNNKPALMRAYKKTILVDGDGDDWVEKKEFAALLLNIFWFNKLWLVFDDIDQDDDRRVDCREFQAGIGKLGLQLSPSDAAEEFKKIDKNGGGQVLFVEFCAYIRTRINPDHDANFDADIHSGESVTAHVRKNAGHAATHGHFVQKKTCSDFDELEKKFKAMMADNASLGKAWKELDFNGNNIVSLAEIDKWVVEKYALLNHKPALMRAYKAAMVSVKQDDWIQKKEFKTLLGYLFYFNKLFWLFDQVDEDHDRRLNYAEFKQCLTIAGVKMSEPKCQEEFKKVDKNGGGIVLFDEFCLYFTKKQCPEALVDFTGTGGYGF